MILFPGILLRLCLSLKNKVFCYSLCCLKSVFFFMLLSSCWSAKTKPKISANTTEPNSHYASPQKLCWEFLPCGHSQNMKNPPTHPKKKTFFETDIVILWKDYFLLLYFLFINGLHFCFVFFYLSIFTKCKRNYFSDDVFWTEESNVFFDVTLSISNEKMLKSKIMSWVRQETPENRISKNIGKSLVAEWMENLLILMKCCFIFFYF